MYKRLFVAIPYDNNHALQIAKRIVLESLDPLITYYNADMSIQQHMHMTLYFLGERVLQQIPLIIQQCEEVVVMHRKDYGRNSLAAYEPHCSFAVWNMDTVVLHCEASDSLRNLASLLMTSFADDSKNRRTFLPHITMVRIKGAKKRNDALNEKVLTVLDEVNDTLHQPILMHADVFTLFSSDEKGYTAIKTFKI